MLNIIYILLLIQILIFISPIIDHFMPEFDETRKPYEIITEIFIQLSIIGFVFYLIFLSNKTRYMNNILTFGTNKYHKILIELICTIVFIGTQRNLTMKLDHITKIHPIRNLFLK